MPGQSVTLGPFIRGYTNRANDPATSDENSLLTADNVLFDTFGNLVSRPPLVEDAVGLGTSELEVLIWTLMPSNSPPPAPEVVDVIVVTNQQGTWISTAGNAWVKVSNNYYAACTQGGRADATGVRHNVIWFAASPNTAGTGGYWAIGDSAITVFDKIPQARSMCWYRSRVWFAGLIQSATSTFGSYIIHSKEYPVANADFDWQAPIPADNTDFSSFFAISSDDGQTVNKIVTYYDSIICLKDSSTYTYSYDYDLATRSQVKNVSPSVGTNNDHTALVYNDVLYTLHERYIYRFTGQSFVPVSETVVIPGSNIDDSLSEYDDNLIARRGTNYYIYDINTQSWTTLSTSFNFNWFVRRPVPRNVTLNTIRYTGGRVGVNSLISFETGYSALRTETFMARIQTKYMYFGAIDRYKRLFSWAAHVMTDQQVRGGVDAVSENREQTVVWDSLSYPDLTLSSPYGYCYKFLKGYRFKQISFKLELDCNGTKPYTIYSVVPVVRASEYTVGKALTSA